MKLSVRTMILIILLAAAIGYTVFNWAIGEIDSETAILYILVLSFPLVRMLSAFLQRWKDANQA